MFPEIPKVEEVRATIRTRTILVAAIVHVGVVIELYALGRLSILNGWDATSWLVLTGLVLIYGGFLLATAFVTVVVWPWVQRIQAAEHWATALARDLPAALEQLPKIVGSVEHLLVAWNESRHPPANPTTLSKTGE